MKLASMAIALMLMPPTPPPPDPATSAEAALIWRDHPLREGYLADFARFAIQQRVTYILTTARVRPGSRQWLAKNRILQDHFWTHIAAVVQDRERPFLECLGRRYQWLTIEEIGTLRQFLSTRTGARFWDSSGLYETDAPQCAGEVFAEDISRVQGEAWDLIGARRPPPPPTID
jgi:hypothetical protein